MANPFDDIISNNKKNPFDDIVSTTVDTEGSKNPFDDIISSTEQKRKFDLSTFQPLQAAKRTLGNILSPFKRTLNTMQTSGTLGESIRKLPTKQPDLQWTSPIQETAITRPLGKRTLSAQDKRIQAEANLDVMLSQLADNIATVGFDSKEDALKTKKKQDFIISRAPIIAGGMASPVAAMAFEMYSQLKNVAVSAKMGKKYDPVDTNQLTDLLPDDTPTQLRLGLSVGEMVGDVALVGTLLNMAEKGILDSTLKQIKNKMLNKGYSKDDIDKASDVLKTVVRGSTERNIKSRFGVKKWEPPLKPPEGAIDVEAVPKGKKLGIGNQPIKAKGEINATPKVDKKSLVTPVERAIGEKQAQEFKVRTPWNNIVDKLDTKKVTSIEENKELFNYFDNPSTYKLSKELSVKVGDDTLSDIKSFKKMLTEEQTGRGLLDSVIDDDEYMRTFLEQPDGSKPTAQQLAALKANTSNSLMERLLGIRMSDGISGISLNNKRYNQARKFENADARDEYLKRFGLQTNRNFLDVMRRTTNQVSKVTSNYEFIKSLRSDAKKQLSGIKEVYDPEIFKQYRKDLLDKIKSIRNSVLEEARNSKIITQQDYNTEVQKTKDFIKTERTRFIDDKDIPKDLMKYELNEIESQYNAIKEVLFNDLKASKLQLTDMAKQRIEDAKDDIMQKLRKEIDTITNKYAQSVDEGLQRPKDVRLAQQLTGLMFTEQQANAIDKVFQTLPPSSVEDIVKITKLFMATGDLFQLPEVVRQRYGVRGIGGLKGTWKFADKDFYEKGIDAVKHGLILGKPSDIAIDIIKKQGKAIENEVESAFMKKYRTLTEKIDKVPGLGKLKEATAKSFQALEDLQWKTVLPNTKLEMYTQLYPKIKSNNPTMYEEDAKAVTARFINDMFQGLNWDRIMAEDSKFGNLINKQIVRNTRIAFFGPDRLASIFRRYTSGFGKNGAEYRKFLLRTMATGVVVLESLNYMLNGHSTLDNTKGSEFELQIPFIKDKKGNPMSINILGTWIEPIKFVYKPTRYIKNKLGIAPRAFGIGVPDYFKPRSVKEWIQDNAPIPFSLQNVLKPLVQDKEKVRTGDVTQKTALTQAALEFSGFPSVFRSGKNREANIFDLINGDTTFFEYLTSNEIRRKKDVPEDIGKYLNEQEAKKSKEKTFAKGVYEGIKRSGDKNRAYESIKSKDKTLGAKIKRIRESEEYSNLTDDEKLIMRLGVENRMRAKYIKSVLDNMSSNRERREYIREMRKKKVISKKVYRQIKKLSKRSTLGAIK